jgi:tetratricopeptide (TPR) repeat protein
MSKMSLGSPKGSIEQELASHLERLKQSPQDAGLERRVGSLLYRMGRYEEALSHYQSAVKLDPKDSDNWYGVGLAASQAGRLTIAQNALQQAVALGRDDGDVRASLAWVLQRLHQPAAAIEQAHRALQHSLNRGRLAWTHAILAASFGDLGDDASKLRHRQEAVKANPQDPEAQYCLGAVYVQQKRFDLAIRHLEKAVALKADQPDWWYALGIAASHVDRLLVARDAFERAIALGRDGSESRAALASVYQRLNEPAAAVAHAKRALEFPLDATLRAQLEGLLGSCYAQIGEVERALVHLEEAVRADPENTTARHNLGALYACRGRYDLALPHLEKAAALNPERSEAWSDLGRAARHLNALDTARKAFQQALASGEDHGNLRAELAWVLQRLGEPHAALQHASRALGFPLDRHQRAWTHTILAACFRDLGDESEALRHYEEAVRADPESAEAQYDLGAALQNCGRYKDALSHLKKATALAPEDADTWHALGHAARSIGDLEKAREALSTAVTLGDDVETRIELARVLQSLGDWDGAIEQGTLALQQTTDSRARSHLHQMLADCWRQSGNVNEALAQLEGAVAIDPTDPDAQYNLGVEYMDRGNWQAAVPHLEQATVLVPDDTGYRLVLAQVYLELGRYAQAEALLRRLLGTDQHESAQILLVQCARDQGRLEEALRLARAEVDTRPRAAVGWVALSQALRAAGDVSGANEALEKALSLDANNPWIVCEAEAQKEEQARDQRP